MLAGKTGWGGAATFTGQVRHRKDRRNGDFFEKGRCTGKSPRRGGGGAAGRSPVRAALQGWRGSPRRGRSAAMGGLHRVVGIDRARGKWES